MTSTTHPPRRSSRPSQAGVSSPVETLAAAQRDYLNCFRALVIKAVAGGYLTSDARKAVPAETERRYPGWVLVAGMPDLAVKNADGVARELGLIVEA